MKRTTTLLTAAVALVVMLGAGTAKAEQLSLRRPASSNPNLLLFNPGALIDGIVSVEYERALAPSFGLSLGMSVSSFRGAFTPAHQASYVAVGPELGARFHFIKDAPGGLWVGPYLGGGYVAAREGGNVVRSFAYGLGAAGGYNFIFGDHFVFQLGVGGGFNDYGEGLAWAPRIRLGLGGVF